VLGTKTVSLSVRPSMLKTSGGCMLYYWLNNA
jgi:hypothetical protein